MDNNKIEEVRSELNKLIDKYGFDNLTNPVIIKKSQELDNLLNKSIFMPQHIELG